MEREIQIQSCLWVDYYFIYDTEANLYEAIKKLEPNIRFIGDDYIGKKFTGDELPINIYFYEISEHNFSTTNLKEKNKKI